MVSGTPEQLREGNHQQRLLYGDGAAIDGDAVNNWLNEHYHAMRKLSLWNGEMPC